MQQLPLVMLNSCPCTRHVGPCVSPDHMLAPDYMPAACQALHHSQPEASSCVCLAWCRLRRMTCSHRHSTLQAVELIGILVVYWHDERHIRWYCSGHV